MKPFKYFIAIVLIVGVGAYFYLDKMREQITETTEPLHLAEDETTEIQHPVPAVPVINGDSDGEKPAETAREEPLPALQESDNRIKEILSEIIGNDLVNQFFKETGIIHRFVVTVDSLPKKEMPLRYRLLPAVAGNFMVLEESADKKATLDPENFTRYNAYMQLLDKLDTELFVKWYTRFYSLIQEDYDSLGYKNRYFNDRFIFAIDHLLETPDVIGSIQLVQPRVFYEFADPALQALSAGQKIFLRIGPANTAIVKVKLLEIRKGLATPQSGE